MSKFYKCVWLIQLMVHISILEVGSDPSKSAVANTSEVVMTTESNASWDISRTTMSTEQDRVSENLKITFSQTSPKPLWSTIPISVNDLPCSVIEEYGTWSFAYKYSRADIASLLCRCKNVCIKVTASPEVNEDMLDLLNNPLSSLNLKEFVPIVTVYSIIFLVGVTGNILTIIGLSTWMKKRSPTYAFIISLSCSDLLLLSVCLPLKVTEYFHLGEVFTEFTCKLSYYLRDYTLTCSVLTLTVISFESSLALDSSIYQTQFSVVLSLWASVILIRDNWYYAICRPLVVQYLCTWERARKIILITWLLSTCLAIPAPFIVQLYTPEGYGHTECLQQSRQEIFLVLYFTYFLGVLFALPSLVMTFTYGCSCYTLWKSTIIAQKLKAGGQQGDLDSGRDETPTKESEDVRSRKRVIKGLVCIVTLFILCWGPSLLVQLLCVMNILRRHCSKYRLAFETLTYISSAVNPYLFMAMSSQFCGPIRRCIFGRHKYRGQQITFPTTTTTTGNALTETSFSPGTSSASPPPYTNDNYKYS